MIVDFSVTLGDTILGLGSVGDEHRDKFGYGPLEPKPDPISSSPSAWRSRTKETQNHAAIISDNRNTTRSPQSRDNLKMFETNRLVENVSKIKRLLESVRGLESEDAR